MDAITFPYVQQSATPEPRAWCKGLPERATGKVVLGAFKQEIQDANRPGRCLAEPYTSQRALPFTARQNSPPDLTLRREKSRAITSPMTAPPIESGLASLRHRVELALRSDQPREQVARLLQTLASQAPEGSPEACFAHRHLAELRLESSPWQAALHLRKVLSVHADDDIAQALMGLSQAVQGNYRAAVAAYRRAVALSPSNPWYNHNLGHLLDVALESPIDALPYLRKAFKAQPTQEEVGASYAHCLGRVGAPEEGIAVVRSLLVGHPRHADLRALLVWLEAGAPKRAHDPARHAAPALSSAVTREEVHSGDVQELDVALALGFERGQAQQVGGLVALARPVWTQLRIEAAVRDRLPTAAWLAALEYHLTRRQGQRGRTLRSLAACYAVSMSAISARVQTLRLREETTASEA